MLARFSRSLTEQPAGRCSSNLHLAGTGRPRVLGSQRDKTGCGLSCNPVPSLASRSPGSGFCLSRAGAHAFTEFLQTLLRKFNFPAPALWQPGNRPNDEEVERCVAAFAYGVPGMPVGGRPKKAIGGVRPAQPKCAPRVFDFLTLMMRLLFLISKKR